VKCECHYHLLRSQILLDILNSILNQTVTTV